MSKLVKMCLGFLLGAMLAACASDPPPAPPATAGGATTTSVSGSSYILGAGDRVRITVYGEDRLSGEFAVTTAGQISFPLIGNIDVKGRSLADVQAMIHDKLSDGYLKDPRVTAEFITYRPYYVLGEVARPGQFQYVDGLTVRQAIAAAGGFTYRARRNRAFLTEPGAAQEFTVDLDKEPNRVLKPGETIRIGERFF